MSIDITSRFIKHGNMCAVSIFIISKTHLYLSACLSVRPRGTTFSHKKHIHEILHFSIFRKYVGKIQILLQQKKNEVDFT